MLDKLSLITAESIKEHREKLRMSQSEFANILGINRTSLYLYESGKRVVPTELIYKLLETFDIEPNDMLKIVKD